jgi:hypothetical protein
MSRARGGRAVRLGILGVCIGLVGLAACVGDEPSAAPPLVTETDASSDGASAGDATTTEGGSSTDAMADAVVSPACDESKPFSPPLLVGLPPSSDGGPTSIQGIALSDDELTLYTYLWRGGDHIYSAKRPVTAAAFAEPALEPVVNTIPPSPGVDRHPFLTADGRSLYFASDRAGGSLLQIYVATRLTAGVVFDAPVALEASVNAAGARVERPWLSNDELWYNRDGDVWVAKRSGSGFATGQPVPILSSPSVEQRVVLTRNGLRVFFVTDRPDGAHNGLADAWTATRPSLGDSFGSPSAVTELNTAMNDGVQWVSGDGCRVYLTSDRSGTSRLYVAERPR